MKNKSRKETNEGNYFINSFLKDTALTREISIKYLKDKRYLEAIDELFRYLMLSSGCFADTNKLNGIQFLVLRQITDFGSALNNMIIGSYRASLNLLRDTMEIEFLFKEFYSNSDSINNWLESSFEEIEKRFSPNTLRQLYANRKNIDIRDLKDHSDYKGHSKFLHVQNENEPFNHVKFDTKSFLFCLADFFEHGRRSINATYDLIKVYSNGGSFLLDPASNFNFFIKAIEETQKFNK